MNGWHTVIERVYRNEIVKIQRKICRRKNWLKSNRAKKTNSQTIFDREVVEREIFLLKQDLAEAKKMLKLCAKN